MDRERQIILVKMCPFVTGNKSNFHYQNKPATIATGGGALPSEAERHGGGARKMTVHYTRSLFPPTVTSNTRGKVTNANRPVIVGGGSWRRKYQQHYRMQGGEAIFTALG